MRNTSTSVQLSDARMVAKLLLSVADQDDNEGVEVESFTINVPVKDAEFLHLLAIYRNELAAARGVQLNKQWKRKSVVEKWVKDAVASERKALATMFETFGPLPDRKDKAAWASYVKRIAAWTKKNSQ